MLFAVDDVGTHGEEISGVHQHPFNAVLDLLDMESWQTFEPGQYRVEQAFDLNLGVLPRRLAGGDQCLTDFVGIEGDLTAIAFVQAVTSYCDQRALHLASRYYI